MENGDTEHNYYGDGREAYRCALAIDSYPEGLTVEQIAEWQEGWTEEEESQGE